MDANKRIWFIDDYRGSRVFVSYRGEWRGFSHGGTLRSLIEAMRDYIRCGTPIHPEIIAPAMSYGDMWGYGAEAAAAVRAEAHQLPLFAQRAAAQNKGSDARNQLAQLTTQLEAIGAGGVESLRKK